MNASGIERRANPVVVESLELRQLFATLVVLNIPSVSLGDDHVLRVAGAGEDVSDAIDITVWPDGISFNGVLSHHQFARADVNSIVIDGHGGDDAIMVHLYAEVPTLVRGGAGNDTIELEATPEVQDNATILGDAGDDRITLGVRTMPGLLDGGDGADTVIGKMHEVLDLNDFTSIENGSATKMLIGTDGPNVLHVLPSQIPSSLPLTLGSQPDPFGGAVLTSGGLTTAGTLTITPVPATSALVADGAVFNTSGSGTLVIARPGLGSPTPATVLGGGGDDTLVGDWGNDRLLGEGGNDHITGNQGNDTLDGGTGNDTLDGRSGQDLLHGRSGRDRLFGGDERDRLNGNGGHDWLFGQSDVDRLYGGDGNDHLDGGSSGDRLYGNAGADALFGQGGDDHLFSIDAITDQLFGGAGSDDARADVIDALADIEQLM